MSRLTVKAWLGFNVAVALLVFLRAGVDRVSIGLVAGMVVLSLIPLFFETRDTSTEPSRLERAAAATWLWFRRLLGFGAASLFLFGAATAAITAEATATTFGMIVFMLFLAGVCAWVGMYGGGRWKAMGKEDVRVHEEHKRRYRWRW